MTSRFRQPARCLAVSLLALCGLLAASAPAEAYIGPGMELGALGAAFGMLMTAVSAVFYLSTLWLRRLWRRVTGLFAATPKATPAEASTLRADP